MKKVTNIIKVSTNWCAACKALQHELDKNPISVPVESIDADDDGYFCDEHDIRSIPVLIFIDQHNNELYRHIGFISSSDIEDKIKELNGELEIQK